MTTARRERRSVGAHRSGARSASRRRSLAGRRRAGGVLAAGLIALLTLSGCSVLGLDAEGPVDATVVTSAAPVATVSTPEGAVTVPTVVTGTTAPAPSPTPWKSLLTTETPTTTSEPPLTAPTTTRTTLTFKTFGTVTAPSVSAPTLIATPPPDCFGDGSCPALATAEVSGGSVVVVNPPGGSNTIAILTSGSSAVDAVSLSRVGSPAVSCSGGHCLLQGTSSGLHFGNLVTVSGGHLTAVPGTATSVAALKLIGSGSSVLVAGAQRFADYGLPVADSPVAARTWALSGGQLSSTGCSAPRLYASAPAVTSAQKGACSGTPAVSGYGSPSAHKMVSLGGFVTPSGNIQCAVVSGKLACTAKQHSFSVKTCTKPTTQVPKGLRGLRVLLATSGSYSYDGCLGYTLVGSPATKIAYGRMAVGSGFICVVQESGVTCTAKNGKGFSLSSSALKRT